MNFNNFRLGISVKWQAFVFSIFVIQILCCCFLHVRMHVIVPRRGVFDPRGCSLGVLCKNGLNFLPKWRWAKIIA